VEQLVVYASEPEWRTTSLIATPIVIILAFLS
jgi:hypothetical protein